MSAVVFSTPGLIDIRAFTHFGVTSKPNTSNPIGYFGTGLKYAIAVLCRLGAEPRLWIGRDEYQFYVRPEKFRDREFRMVRMRRRRWSLTRSTHHSLPFTTELGKNWEAWQAFRELEANTRDEDGLTWLAGGEQEVLDQVQAGHTVFAVDCPAFTEAYHDRAKTFLPEGLSVREDGARVQVLDRPSQHIYYRGLRVADVPKPTLYTYNFLSDQTLTEDRTLKWPHMARAALASHVVTSHDAQFIENVVTAKDQNWEHGLEYDYQSEAPSDEFHSVVARRRGAVSSSLMRYYGGWEPRGSARKTARQLHPGPWEVRYGAISDAAGKVVLLPGGDVVYKDQLLQDIVDLWNHEDC